MTNKEALLERMKNDTEYMASIVSNWECDACLATGCCKHETGEICDDVVRSWLNMPIEPSNQPAENPDKPEHDPVNHPSYYTQGGIETIDYIESHNLNFCRGNACKYISRAGDKDPAKEIEDLQKAVWYLNHEISRLEKEAAGDGGDN